MEYCETVANGSDTGERRKEIETKGRVNEV